MKKTVLITFIILALTMLLPTQARAADTYTVHLMSNNKGIVEVDNTHPSCGDGVNIYIVPMDGMKVGNIYIFDTLGNGIPFKVQGEIASYIQPKSDVIVQVNFSCDGKTSNCPSKSLIDVNADANYHTAVDKMIEYGIMKGYSETEFKPDKTLTRAEFVQILYNMAKAQPTEYKTNYKDVSEADWYSNAVAWSTELGLTVGYGNGYFGPNDNLTVEQTLIMLFRYADAYGITNNSIDTYLSELKTLNEANADFNNINIKVEITRAQIAQVIDGFLSLV